MEKRKRFTKGLEEASGKIGYRLTNDVIIHCSVQRSERMLKGLVCSLMGLEEAEVDSVMLLNPIDYRTYEAKEIILDIKVMLNNSQIINVELQVLIGKRRKWWKNRSLLYLCRCYDNIKSGTDYDKLMPATQISIVFDDLFPDEEREFYSKYRLLNVRTNIKYTGNFALNVLYLNHIDVATEEDKKNGLLHWAKAFLAETCEDLKTLANESDIFREVAETVYAVNINDSAKTFAEAHEKYLSTIYLWEREVEEARKELEEKKAEVEEVKSENEKLKAENAELKRQLAEASK